MTEKIWVGFITYGEATFKYLPFFLDSLSAQVGTELKIVAVDNSEHDQSNLKYLNNRPEIELLSSGKNLGFGKAYNLMLQKAIDQGAEYFLVINPDVILETDVVIKLVERIRTNQLIGSVCPKLRRWDFNNQRKTNLIDSCGIVLRPALNFFDLGQGEADQGQYDNATILGPSGAAALFRLSALKSVMEATQYFDEHFFMYKEDCDLAMRLSIKGHEAQMVAQAIGYHDRTAEGQGHGLLARIRSRRAKSRQVKSWSFVNQQLIYWKYWQRLNFNEKIKLVIQQCSLLTYIILLEPYLLIQLPQIAIKRRGIKCYY